LSNGDHNTSKIAHQKRLRWIVCAFPVVVPFRIPALSVPRWTSGTYAELASPCSAIAIPAGAFWASVACLPGALQTQGPAITGFPTIAPISVWIKSGPRSRGCWGKLWPSRTQSLCTAIVGTICLVFFLGGAKSRWCFRRSAHQFGWTDCRNPTRQFPADANRCRHS
jgi:hypothetical protein